MNAPLFKYGIVAVICLAAIPLLAIENFKWLGWLMLGSAAIITLTIRRSHFGQHISILIAMLGLLGLTPINTNISYAHMVFMGATLVTTIAVPYLLSRYVVLDRALISLPFGSKRKWHRREIAYIALAGTIAYLVLPFYLANTGSYHNWSVQLDTSHIVRFFIGTNALGIWDELFFVGVCLALLRRHLPFWAANIAQAAMWTTFLYELGFRGWGPLPIFIFALTQGIVFQRSKSLLYLIAIHLTIDFILFLTLIHLNYPEILRIFITAPF